jgi:hypothetical protein
VTSAEAPVVDLDDAHQPILTADQIEQQQKSDFEEDFEVDVPSAQQEPKASQIELD